MISKSIVKSVLTCRGVDCTKGQLKSDERWMTYNVVAMNIQTAQRSQQRYLRANLRLNKSSS